MRTVLSIAATSALLVGFSGCGGGGDGLPRQAVSGNVTFDGQPLASGTINFEPVDLNTGQPATGTIEDGAYEIDRDAGPTPGSYVVRITSARQEAPLSAAEAMEQGAVPAGEEVVEEPIAPKYNAQSGLKADVTEGGENTFSFQVSKS